MLLEGGIEVVHVGLVVLAVVDLHRLRIDVRLERPEVVGQDGERVARLSPGRSFHLLFHRCHRRHPCVCGFTVSNPRGSRQVPGLPRGGPAVSCSPDGARLPTSGGSMTELLLRWFHFLAGITWIGLLYYFNFVQGPFFAEADAATKSSATQKLVPRALWWFRWSALATFLTGALIIAKRVGEAPPEDRKSTRLNSSHVKNSDAVFCLKKKKTNSCRVVAGEIIGVGVRRFVFNLGD